MSELSKNKIKWIRSLQLKKFRDLEDLYIIEGEKMVKEALEFSPSEIHSLIITDEFLEDTTITGKEVYTVNQKILSQISTLKTPNKGIAIMKRRMNSSISADNLILALDNIQDPGNLGTILRIADWFGVKDIICSKNTVDCYNSKVVQSCMGAILRVNVHYLDLEHYFDLNPLPVYGALLIGENVYQTELKSPGILLVGNEGKGISKELLSHISHPITIPKFGGAESLNVSVATGIILSEFKRQD